MKQQVLTTTSAVNDSHEFLTVVDNDVSGFKINKVSVNVTEGGATDAYTVVLTSEPFANVTVSVTNIGTVGNFAVPNPSKLTFTSENWDVSQLVTVTAFDDKTEDVVGSFSYLNHSLATDDLIYAELQDLASVEVYIADNDKSGIELPTREMYAVESNTTMLWYSVRLTSEPWKPVVLSPVDKCRQPFLKSGFWGNCPECWRSSTSLTTKEVDGEVDSSKSGTTAAWTVAAETTEPGRYWRP